MQLTVSFLLTKEAEKNQSKQKYTKYGAQDSCYNWNDVTVVRARTKSRGSWKQDNG